MVILNRYCRRALTWVGIPMLLCGTAYFAKRESVSHGLWSPDQPVLEVTGEFDLGEVELGQEVDRPVRFANRGGAELVVDDIRTTCSCTALQADENGTAVTVSSVRLPPGATRTLTLRVSARGRPGLGAVLPVSFRSNDPARPTGAINVTISRFLGGIYTTPANVVFGEVPAGGESRRTVTIFDYVSPPRKVEKVVSTNPDMFAARLLPPGADATGRQNYGGTDQVAGQVEVVLAGRHVGAFHGEIEIHLADRPGRPDIIRAFGRVVGLVEVSPTSAVLPRATGSGLSNRASCICRSTDGTPLILAIGPVPAGFHVSVLDPERAAPVKTVQITWDSGKSNSGATATRHIVRLRASVGARETALEIPVICRGKEGSE